MAPNPIDAILEQRRLADKGPDAATEESKHYSILVGDGSQENYLELRFRDGLQLCLSYGDLVWFHYLPDEQCIDLEFGGFLVSIKGKGLGTRLFNGLKQKRVAWVKEADSELEDHKDNPTFIEEITLIPPKGFGGGEPDAGE